MSSSQSVVEGRDGTQDQTASSSSRLQSAQDARRSPMAAGAVAGGRDPEALDDADGEEENDLIYYLYSAESFSAVVFPVGLSMVLATLCVVFINDGANGTSSGGGGSAGGLPIVYEERATDSDGQRITGSIVNALVIIGVIAGATFVMVGMFYFGYIRLLFAWLMASTGLLLAFSTGLMVQTAFFIADVPADAITYAFVFYNFAIGGLISVYWQKGIPTIVGQGYLIIISVTMAWILVRYLPDWTAWALLAALCLWDLFAVLTPCGPLRWLVGIMQKRDQPLPGLLYEAQIGNRSGPTPAPAPPSERPPIPPPSTRPIVRPSASGAGATLSATGPSVSTPGEIEMTGPAGPNTDSSLEPAMPTANSAVMQRELEAIVGTNESFARSTAHNIGNSTVQPAVAGMGASTTSFSMGERDLTSPAALALAMRQAAMNDGPGTQNTVRHRRAQRRQAASSYGSDDSQDDYEDDDTIKLGLGDFVFYSLICAKAGLVSFATAVSVFISVLLGLALTLILLAVYRMALPALPISLILGIIVFFLSEQLIIPIMNDLSWSGVWI